MNENQGEKIIREVRIIRICFIILTGFVTVAFVTNILNIRF